MRKLVLFMHVSLDNFAANTNGGLDWISYDGELPGTIGKWHTCISEYKRQNQS